MHIVAHMAMKHGWHSVRGEERRDSLDDYEKVESVLPGYQKLPCRECGKEEWYNPQFCYTHDEGLCDECRDVDPSKFKSNVTVRL